MPYASGRVIHDADAHIMELPGFLEDHLEAKYRGRVGDSVLFPRREGFHSHLEEAHKDGAGGADFDESQIMLAKNWAALGSSARQDRPRTLVSDPEVKKGLSEACSRFGPGIRTSSCPATSALNATPFGPSWMGLASATCAGR